MILQLLWASGKLEGIQRVKDLSKIVELPPCNLILTVALRYMPIKDFFRELLVLQTKPPLS